jgi:predicted RNA methylase
VVAVEINTALAAVLPRELAAVVVVGDFLTASLEPAFDRILTNPPFERGADIEHVLHAFELLAAGGRLVAVVADGPRERERLRPWVIERGGTWEELPADTFAEQGTKVRAAMLVVEALS